MSPVERLQAAIAKLEQLRDDADRGTWMAWRSGLPGRERFGVETGEGETDVVWGVRRAPNAELIETLHRTIDAQIAILQSAVEWFAKAEAEWGTDMWLKHPDLAEALRGLLQQELSLADTILGTQS